MNTREYKGRNVIKVHCTSLKTKKKDRKKNERKKENRGIENVTYTQRISFLPKG